MSKERREIFSKLSGFTDSELVELCQQQEHQLAFEFLVRRYEVLLRRVALRYLNNEADAEDVTQDAFIKAYRGLTGFRHQSTFKTWLFRILHNECMTRLAARKRQFINQTADLEIENLADEAVGFDHFQQYFEDDAIQKTLYEMNEQDRYILLLRHVADLSLQEAANTLDLTLSAAKMRFYRAQERFIDIYNQINQQGGTH